MTTTVGKNLRRLRKDRGMGQVALSEASGVAQPTISDIERGLRDPHSGTLRKLAGALGVEMVAFFGEGEARPFVPRLPRTPLTKSTPEALEIRLFGAPVEESEGELIPVLSEPEARELSDALFREQLALESWIKAYASAPSAERFDRRADHDRAQTLRKRAAAFYGWTFDYWTKLYDPRGVPFKGARQFATETDEAVALFLDVMRAEGERTRIENAGEAG